MSDRAISPEDLAVSAVGIPYRRGRHTFRLDNATGSLSVDGRPFAESVLRWTASPDGRYCAVVHRCDPVTVRVMAASDGRLVGVVDARCTLRASSWSREGLWMVDEGSPDGEHRALSRYVLGGATHRVPTTDRLGPVRSVTVAPDDSTAVVVSSLGGRDFLFLLDDPAESGTYRAVPIATGAPGTLGDVAMIPGGDLLLRSDSRASRGEILRRDAGTGDWRVVVAEDDVRVLRRMYTAGSTMLLHSTEHGQARLDLYPDAAPVPVPVRLPSDEPMSVDAVDPPHRTHDGWFAVMSSPGVEPALYEIDASATVRHREGPMPSSTGRRTERTVVTASDGVEISMFLSRDDDAARPDDEDGPPTLVVVYGGFGLPVSLTHSAAARAWTARGGLWVTVAVRGGGDEGRAWHTAGSGRAKRRGIDDLGDAVRHLVGTGTTSARRIGLYGASHGGLVVTSLAARYPELCGAVVCSSPVTDLLRFHRDWPGRSWIGEFGDPDNADDAEWLGAISPVHTLRDDVPQPAVLITVGGADTVVANSHADDLHRCWNDVLAGGAGGGPVELRRYPRADHAFTDPVDATARAADEVQFLERALIGRVTSDCPRRA